MKAIGKEDWNSLYHDVISKDDNIVLDAVISVASDTDSRLGTLQLINSVPNIYGGFGIHPLYAKEYNPQTEIDLIQIMENPKTIAWGEIGLDYHEFGPQFSYAKPELQKSVFISQMKNAINLKKPIIIHTREAEEETFNLMKEYIPNDWKIDVHCYTDSLDFALKLLKEWENLYLGFSGVITFKSAHQLRQVVQSVPLEKLLIETDGPFLAPEPFRGKTGHPGYIPLIVSKIAEIKSLPPSTIYETTRINTRSIFGV
jgi:TatD DNase family protein